MSSTSATDDDRELSEVSFEELVEKYEDLERELEELKERFEDHLDSSAKARGEARRRITRLENEKEVLSTYGDSKVDNTARIILQNFDALARRTKHGMTVSTTVDGPHQLGLTELFEREVDELDVDTTTIKLAMKRKIAEAMPSYEYRDEGKYEPKHLDWVGE